MTIKCPLGWRHLELTVPSNSLVVSLVNEHQSDEKCIFKLFNKRVKNLAARNYLKLFCTESILGGGAAGVGWNVPSILIEDI